MNPKIKCNITTFSATSGFLTIIFCILFLHYVIWFKFVAHSKYGRCEAALAKSSKDRREISCLSFNMRLHNLNESLFYIRLLKEASP